jgi:restriction endonuclease Mrr
VTDELPKSNELTKILVEILKNAEREMSVKEIEEQIISHFNIPKFLQNKIRIGKRTELSYRLSWARTNAKNKGLIKRSSPRNWRAV